MIERRGAGKRYALQCIECTRAGGVVDKVEKEDMIGWITCSKCNCARVIVMKKAKERQT